MAWSDRVLSITQDSFVPAVIDEVFNSNVLLCRTLARANKRWTGESKKVPILVSKATNGGSFDGTDVFDTAAQDNTRKLSFDVKWYYQSVVVPGTERIINSGEAGQVSLVQAIMEVAKDSMLDSLGNQFYGTGTGKDFLGLGAIVDDGTDVSTYGGLSRTTYTVLNASRTAASGGALTLDLMASQFDNASAASSASEAPSLGVTTKPVWSLYESLLQPTVQARYNAEGYPQVNAYTASGQMARGEALRGRAGFNSLDFRGVPIVGDEKCTTGNLFFLNEKYLNFHYVNMSVHPEIQGYNRGTNSVVEGVYSEPGRISGNYPMYWKPLAMPTNQLADIGQFLMGGNLIGEAPRRMSRITGITTV